MNRKRPEPIAVPEEKKLTYTLTNTGKFSEGDLTISREGLQINSPASTLNALRPGSANSVQPSTKKSSAAEDDAASLLPEDASTSDLTPDDLEETCVLGQGSSGVAKKVRNKRGGPVLVLKVIQFDVSSDVVRKQVTTELRTLYGARHPNVVRYYQAFFDNGAISIVMEFMDKGSLADVLKQRKKLSERHLAAIARQLVTGLTYLHKELKVVHRDIKPSNLLLSSGGDVKISDFGVSGQLASSISNCMSWVGTVTYMSPERIRGDAYSFDSDIWALGLTLLECALGRFPYPPQDTAAGPNAPQAAPLGFWELLEYIVVEPAPQLPKEQFSTELCSLIAACLQKESKARPTVANLAAHPFLAMHKDASLAELW